MQETVRCHLAAVPMRKEPSDKSEMVNQVLFGETATILDQNEKWFMLRLDHDGYEGWVDRKQVVTARRYKRTSSPVRKLFEQHNGYVLPAGALTEDDHPSSSAGDIESVALMFLHTPYLWGGRSFMGIDCSGFTQVVFRILGKQIPRDAWQQAETGDTVSFIDESEKGDLAFFDNAEGRITHVGIVLGKTDDGSRNIIHASGEVRLDFIDHQGIFNVDSQSYSHKLRVIKRI